MVPALLPGDRVLAVRTRPREGDVVAMRDPRDHARIIVKRLVRVVDDGALEVVGDNAAESTDSREFGPVPRDLVVGRVVYRYAPTDRAGRVERRPLPG